MSAYYCPACQGSHAENECPLVENLRQQLVEARDTRLTESLEATILSLKDRLAFALKEKNKEIESLEARVKELEAARDAKGGKASAFWKPRALEAEAKWEAHKNAFERDYNRCFEALRKEQAKIAALEKERDEAVKRGDHWCLQTKTELRIQGELREALRQSQSAKVPGECAELITVAQKVLYWMEKGDKGHLCRILRAALKPFGYSWTSQAPASEPVKAYPLGEGACEFLSHTWCDGVCRDCGKKVPLPPEVR